MIFARGHEDKCAENPCGLCRALHVQAEGAKTTKDDRKRVTLQFRQSEIEAISLLAEGAGISKKALLESVIRDFLDGQSRRPESLTVCPDCGKKVKEVSENGMCWDCF